MKKSYLILVIVLLIGIFVWFLEQPGQHISDFSPFMLYSKLPLDEVVKIEIEHLIDGTRLLKNGDQWRAEEIQTQMGEQIPEKKEFLGVNYKGNKEKIEKILNKIKKLEAKNFVSENPEKQVIYQVGKLGKHVKIYKENGDVLANFYIGKNGDTPFISYVRREGEDEVYLATVSDEPREGIIQLGENINGLMPADVMSWRDKTIWSVVPNSVEELDIQLGKKELFKIVNKDDEAMNKIFPFIKEMSTMETERFAYIFDPKDTGFENPHMTIHIKTSMGDEKKLIIGKKNDQGFWFARLDEPDSEIYLLGSSFVDEISKKAVMDK